MLPDLVVAAISTSGAPTVVGSNVEVPLTVVVKNQGSAAAGAFKVSVDFSRAGAAPLAVAFSVPGQDLWYPKATGLNGGSSVTFTGKLLFLNSVHGAVSTIAMADSCSGDEFMPEHCRVKESNEANNRSTAGLSRFPRFCARVRDHVAAPGGGGRPLVARPRGPRRRRPTADGLDGSEDASPRRARRASGLGTRDPLVVLLPRGPARAVAQPPPALAAGLHRLLHRAAELGQVHPRQRAAREAAADRRPAGDAPRRRHRPQAPLLRAGLLPRAPQPEHRPHRLRGLRDHQEQRDRPLCPHRPLRRGAQAGAGHDRAPRGPARLDPDRGVPSRGSPSPRSCRSCGGAAPRARGRASPSSSPGCRARASPPSPTCCW